MGGLFSGFGRKDKAEASKNSDDKDAKPNLATPDKPLDSHTKKDGANSAHESAINEPESKTEHNPDLRSHRSTTYDRSNIMRLSKTNPAKADEDFDIPGETVIPSFSSSTINKATTSEVRTAPPTAVIGPKITFKGELSGEEDLLVEGKVEGTIELKNNQLTIGKQGVVKANVVAKSITIEGTIEGDLVAADRIAIKASSNVQGNVTADRVTLEDGAKFRGSIDMDTKGAPSPSAAPAKNDSQAEKA